MERQSKYILDPLSVEGSLILSAKWEDWQIDEILDEIEDGNYTVEEKEDVYLVTTADGYDFELKKYGGEISVRG
jgi:hypothetical protein